MIASVPPTRPFALVACAVFTFTAITSTGALLAWLALRPRHDDGRLQSAAVYLAHAMLLAVIVLFGLWLQALRTLTPTVTLLLIGLYAAVELALLFGTRGSVELPMRR
jgi:ABC-type proline/glycine betaine transport system permease subunit